MDICEVEDQKIKQHSNDWKDSFCIETEQFENSKENEETSGSFL